jgi:hypothetical protein
MSALNEPIAKRIAKLLRLLASPHDGERDNAVRMLQRTLAAERLSFNDIAIVIENHQGEIEERKYSDTDAEIIFAKGVEKGRKDEERKQQAPPEFYDAEGQPRWNAIALFCQNNITRLNAWERDFINNMAGKTLWRQPTEKESKHLLAVFVKLGGHYEPQAAHVRR